jgi:predicted nucleotidyltransferase
MTTDDRQQTLPSEVSAVLDVLLPAIHEALGDRIVSIVLWGSAVLGDYRPGRSDVDIIVVLDRDPDSTTLVALQPVHDRIDADLSAWRDRIEVAYVGVESLRRFRERAHVIARISPGEPLNLRTADGAWRIDWFQAAHDGVTLFGAAARDVMPSVSVDEMRAEAARQLRGWVRVPTDADARYLAYVVLVGCRAMHAIAEGRQASKRGAARWLAARHPQWAELVTHAAVINEVDHPAADALAHADVERFLSWCACRPVT